MCVQPRGTQPGLVHMSWLPRCLATGDAKVNYTVSVAWNPQKRRLRDILVRAKAPPGWPCGLCLPQP